jgi:hypothetical protein
MLCLNISDEIGVSVITPLPCELFDKSQTATGGIDCNASDSGRLEQQFRKCDSTP